MYKATPQKRAFLLQILLIPQQQTAPLDPAPSFDSSWAQGFGAGGFSAANTAEESADAELLPGVFSQTEPQVGPDCIPEGD